MKDIKNNSSILRTTQCTNTGLSPVCCWGPAHSIDFCIIALEICWRHPHKKYGKIYCLIKEDETWLTFSMHLLMPVAAMTMKIGCVAAGLQGFPMFQKTCWELLRKSNRERHSIIHNTSEHSCVWILLWQTITPKQNMRETPNFRHMVRWNHTIDGGPRPLLASHTIHTSTSDYSWGLIIDNFLYRKLEV